MNHYPIMVDLNEKNVVVAGGGNVAYRKMKSLVDSGARVTVIGSRVIDPVKRLAEEGKIVWRQRNWQRGDGDSAFLLIAATDSEEVNRQIAKTALPNQLVNVINAPEIGNFHVPASLRRGRLTIAVSTDGASPLLARKIRDDTGDRLGSDIEQYLDFLFRFREMLKVKVPDSRLKKLCLEKILEPRYRTRAGQEKVLQNLNTFIKNVQTKSHE